MGKEQSYVLTQKITKTEKASRQASDTLQRNVRTTRTDSKHFIVWITIDWCVVWVGSVEESQYEIINNSNIFWEYFYMANLNSF